MNRDQLFDALDEVIVGKKGERSSVLKEYRDLSPADGLKKAKEYLEQSRGAQEKAGSDLFYWLYEGDITIAQVLMAIFTALEQGREDFLPFPSVEDMVLMDKQASLVLWAKNLLAEQ